MKKLIGILLSLIMLCSFSFSCFATSVGAGTMYTYTFENGRVVNYYLDENNMPYVIEDGEKMYVALPLESLRIQDANSSDNNGISTCATIGNPTIINRDPPSNLYDLTLGGDDESNVYSAYASFANYNAFFSRDFKLNTNHKCIRIKTKDIEKPLFGSNEISFLYKYYEPEEGIWYQIIISDATCTGVYGFAFQHSPDVFPYGQVVILIPDDITSCTVNIWTALEN